MRYIDCIHLYKTLSQCKATDILNSKLSALTQGVYAFTACPSHHLLVSEYIQQMSVKNRSSDNHTSCWQIYTRGQGGGGS